MFRFNCTVAGIEKVEPEHKAKRASVAVITPTDRSNAVRNRCIFEYFGGVFFFGVVTLLLQFSICVWDFVIRLSQVTSFSR